MSVSPSRLLRIGGLAGILGPLIAISMVFYSVSISPWFTWQGNSLSDLGVSSAAIYFNSGLVIEGVMNLFFAAGIWAAFQWTSAKNVVGPFVGVSGVSLGFVGIFTEHSGSLHGDFALAYFILFPISLMVAAAVAWRKGRLFAVMTSVAGIAALIAIFMTPHQSGALAIPEIFEALILAGWSIIVGIFMAVNGSLPGVSASS